MNDILERGFDVVGIYGYLVLLLLGPFALGSAGRGGPLLPLAFRTLAVLVVTAQFKFIYFYYFDLSKYSASKCVGISGFGCAIARVKERTNGESPELVLEYYDSNRRLIQRQYKNLWRFKTIPHEGEDVLVGYSFNDTGRLVEFTEPLLPRRRNFVSFLLATGLLALGYSIWIEHLMRKRWRRNLATEDER